LKRIDVEFKQIDLLVLQRRKFLTDRIEDEFNQKLQVNYILKMVFTKIAIDKYI